jgi:hypothetical protein
MIFFQLENQKAMVENKVEVYDRTTWLWVMTRLKNFQYRITVNVMSQNLLRCTCNN